MQSQKTAERIAEMRKAGKAQKEKITCPRTPMKKSTPTQKPAPKNSPKINPEKKGSNCR
jgi:hypothetical protein